MGRRGGNAQVSAAKGGPPALCKVVALIRDGSDEIVRVHCRDVAGQLVDADFMIVFTHRVGLTGVHRPAAYLLADRPTSGSYVPQAKFRYSIGRHEDQGEAVGRGSISRDASRHATRGQRAGDGIRCRVCDLPGDEHPEGSPATAHRGGLFRPDWRPHRQSVHAQLHALNRLPVTNGTRGCSRPTPGPGMRTDGWTSRVRTPKRTARLAKPPLLAGP